MLTREDVQFDFLDAVFSDTTRVFTDQRPGHSDGKVTFSEMYINSIQEAGRCTKAQRDKMKESPAFAIELAKVSLLINVGRINTTMACT